MADLQITLNEIGRHRSRVILALKQHFQISLAQARDLANWPPIPLESGEKWRIVRLEAALVSAGASVTVDYYFSPDLRATLAKRFSDDGVHCRDCGGRVFVAVPKITSRQEIQAFAQTTNWADRETIIKDGWIHPGVYCGQCSRSLLVEFCDLSDLHDQLPRHSGPTEDLSSQSPQP